MFEQKESGFWDTPENDNEHQTEAEISESEQEPGVISHEKIDHLMRKHIKNLLTTKEGFLGSGNISHAHSNIDEPRFCFKLTTERTSMGKNIPPPNVPLTSKENRTPIDSYHIGPEKEGEFLKELNEKNFDESVIVPAPCAWATFEQEDEGDTYYAKEKIHVLVMETIQGPTVGEVIRGEKELPKNFDPDTFFPAVYAYIEKMHTHGIYHRDLHQDNLMIDTETGKPCIIDFGRGAYGSEEDAYQFQFSENGKVHTGQFTRDEDYVSQTEREIRAYLNQKS
ncbi:MAG: phosphotransferase [Candidatus Paceibacterota bacterium]